MSYNLGSAGMLAILEEENKTCTKYTYTSHNTSCKRYTFEYRKNNNDKIRIMIVNEEDNQTDAIFDDCCKLFKIIKEEFNKFFIDDDQTDIKNNILRNCRRLKMGMGYEHCIFYKLGKGKGPFSIPSLNHNNLTRKCTKKLTKKTVRNIIR